MTYVAYHSKLEISFLMDEYAMPPAGPDENQLHLEGISETTPLTPEEKRLRALSEESTESQKSDSGEVEVKIRQETPPVSKQISMAEEKKTVKEEVSKGSGKKEEGSSEGAAPNTPSEVKKHMKRPSKEAKEIVDFSDPLQSYQQSQDESIFETKSKHTLTEEKRKVSHGFKKALDDMILSASPYLKYDVPYLETAQGSQCKLRQYFPKDLYWSRHLNPVPVNEKRSSKFIDEEEEKRKKRIRELAAHMLPAHPFVFEKITSHIMQGSTQVSNYSVCTDKTCCMEFQSAYLKLRTKISPYIETYAVYTDGLVQGRRNSSALAMKLRLSCTNPSIQSYDFMSS